MGKSSLDQADLESIDNDFVFAALNQQYFDALYYNAFNKSLNDFHGIPRPSKWLGKNWKSIKIIKLLSRTMSFGWAYVVFYVYSFAKLHKLALKKSKLDSNEIMPDAIALAVCDHSCKTILKTSSSHQSFAWLLPPNDCVTDQFKARMNSATVDVLAVLSWKEILLLFIKSLLAHQLILNRHGISLAWQSYPALDWMLTYGALIKIKPKLVLTAEHHDRWAVMADCYCNTPAGIAAKSAVELTQHGKESSSTYEFFKIDSGAKGLPYKLMNVVSLFVYSNEQLDVFLESIIRRDDKSRKFLCIDYISQSIDLTKTEDLHPTILFVGHSICESFQMALCERLSLRHEICVYYKPHPTAAHSQEAEDANWTIIQDKNFFPAVDFIISYPSTLVDEYSTMQIEALVHPLNAKDCDLEIYVELALDMIKRTPR